jgi:hypothetical protein
VYQCCCFSAGEAELLICRPGLREREEVTAGREKGGKRLCERERGREREMHLLTSCQMYDHIRDTNVPQFRQSRKDLENKPDFDQLPYLWVK